MLMIRVEPLETFLDAIYLLHRFGKNANIECSPTMFSLVVPHHYLEVVTAFQTMPEFYTTFYSNNTYNSRTVLEPLFTTIKRMQEEKFSALSLFVLEPFNRLVLKFYSPRNDLPLIRKLGMLCEVKEEFGSVDLEFFVSIESQQFRHIVTECRDYFVSLTPIHSHAKFSNHVKEFVFSQEKGECIIGGVVEDLPTEFQIIPVFPYHIFYQITFQSKRIWFFKSTDRRGTLIIAPVGLFAQLVIYFPDVFD